MYPRMYTPMSTITADVTSGVFFRSQCIAEKQLRDPLQDGSNYIYVVQLAKPESVAIANLSMAVFLWNLQA